MLKIPLKWHNNRSLVIWQSHSNSSAFEGQQYSLFATTNVRKSTGSLSGKSHSERIRTVVEVDKCVSRDEIDQWRDSTARPSYRLLGQFVTHDVITAITPRDECRRQLVILNHCIMNRRQTFAKKFLIPEQSRTRRRRRHAAKPGYHALVC